MARNGKRVKPDQLAPKIEAGFTEGPITPAEAAREFPVQKAPTQGYAHMSATHARGEPYAAMVVERNGVPIQDPNTGRWMEDVDVIITEEEAGQIRDGYRCLRCKEPFERPFPLNCEVCGYEVRSRQAVDARLELDGERHVGPSRPLSAIMAELELRQQKALFEQKIEEGGSRGRRNQG
jgi:hypothetical protein